MGTVMTVIVGILAIGGASAVLVSAIAVRRMPDAISRVNVLSPATGVGLPALVAAAWLHWTFEHGFDWLLLAKALVAIVAFIVSSSVASNALGRAAFRSGAPVNPQTQPNHLAHPPESDSNADSDSGP